MSTSVLESKDRRSYEYARQHHLHPSDRHHFHNPSHKPIGNSRKTYLIPPSRVGRQWGVDARRLGDEAVHIDSDVIDEDVNVVWDGGMDYCAQEELVAYDDDVAEPTRDSSELTLADLIRPERKRNGIAQGYEIIPRVRPVMIIDEGSSSSGSSEDDEEDEFDWEVVPEVAATSSKRRSKAKKAISYAAAARGSSTK